MQLKKRWDLVPQLVNIVKGYAVHESALLEKLIDARARAQSSSSPSTLSHQRINKEQVLTQHCSQVVALAESYPELKASEQFMMLQRNLAEIEAQVAASRRSYNAYVVRYNNAIESFPSNIIASRHEFRLADYFSIDLTERENVRL
ncbi:MAG: LemA family protein [Akkermansiaceae bacterium]